MLSRDLLNRVVKDNEGNFTESLAKLWLVTSARYKDSSKLKRGELDIPIRDMVKLFGWSRYLVTDFLRKLEKAGKISFRYTNVDKRRIICLTNYNLYTGASLDEEKESENIIPKVEYDAQGNPITRSSRQRLAVFWEIYHDVFPMVSRTDFVKTRRLWNQMKCQYQRMAIDNIEEFASRIKDNEQRKAYSYLKYECYKMD